MTLTPETDLIPLVMDENGVIRVGGTRVTLDAIVYAFLEGATPEEIALQYPSLSLSDIYSALGCYLHRRDEVEQYLRQREALRDQVKKENEERFPPTGVRARLLSSSTVRCAHP